MQNQLVFIAGIENLTRRNRQTIRRWWSLDKFPKPVQIQGRNAWRQKDIDEWVKERMGVKD